VIIPFSNMQNLMLRRDVIAAVKKKRFHVYRVASVSEAIEVLTGVPAGQPDDEGNFPPETVYGEVQKKLQAFFERACRIGKGLDLKLE
jgi:predicted ATP-dependent protease